MILPKLMRAIARRRQTLTLSREERDRRNLERFRDLAAFVQEHSPWYRRVIAEHRIDVATCRPEDFPVLTTEDVRDHFDDIVTDRAITRAGIDDFLETSTSPRDLYLGRYHLAGSSGSSGLPGYYLHTTDELVNGMSYGIFHRRLKPRTRTSFIGILHEHKMSTAVMGLMDRWPERLLFNTCNFDIKSPWAKIISGLNAHRPQVISAYKHVLMTLAEEARAGRLFIEPILLESGGEPLFPHERAFLRETFGCEVANSYGSSEINLMGVALNDWEGIYLFEDDLIFELTDDMTCVTNLYNRALPMIRYGFDDVLVPVEVANPRLPFQVVSEGVGRAQDLISFPTGEGEDQKFEIVVFEDVDFTGLRRVGFEKVDPKTMGVRLTFAEEAGAEGSPERAARLETLIADMRAFMDERGLQGIALDVSVIGDDVEPESRLVSEGRKEKLIRNKPA